MNVIIYALKRGFDVQKAERYFKERNIPYQYVDLGKRPIGQRELRAVAGGAGARSLVYESAPSYRESTLPYISGEDGIFAALAERPSLLKAPIVRFGPKSTVGYRPDVWDGWAIKG